MIKSGNVARESAFERTVLASELLGRDEIARARAQLQSEGAAPAQDSETLEHRLADKLVELGLLNSWQAQQLLHGRTKFHLGPYWIVDSLGQGGMGQVFTARKDKTGPLVAVKVLPRSKSTPDAVAYFNREVEVLARLDHENLVRALDHGHDGNVHFLVTEYVPGSDLRALVRGGGPLSMTSAASIVSQVALGLQHAHELGIIHRDVKPGNVLVTPDGHAKLLDLGLAGSLESEPDTDPRHGKIMGTVDYLSPDQIRWPTEPSPAWDIYSLGCTLYYAVTGQVPFPGGSIAEKARAHCEREPVDPCLLNPNLSEEFVEVVAQMMAKRPSERLQSTEEVIARLSPWTGLSVSPEAMRQAMARRRKRPRAGSALQAAPDVIGDSVPAFFDETPLDMPIDAIADIAPASASRAAMVFLALPATIAAGVMLLIKLLALLR